jgi:dihydropteroate synthase
LTRLPTLTVRQRTFTWGDRTYVAGILNLTPDSFSGDGLARHGTDAPSASVEQARRMVDEGADLLDIGGESTRPGHGPVAEEDEIRRTIPAIRAVREALPDVPISVDTRKPPVAAAALDAGADILNDVSAVGPELTMARLAAERSVPYVLMHARTLGPDAAVLDEVVRDLRAAVERALRLGCPEGSLIVDPGIGFGKTASQNLVLLRGLESLGVIGCPVLLGTSRKSTIGRVLDLGPDERLEGTLATTALAVAARVDIVRVHDVLPNVRVARMADAIVRGWRDPQSEA